MKKKIISIAVAIMMVFSVLVGCGKVISGPNSSKETILFSVYDGGLGTKWIEDMMNEYNKTSEKYYFTFEGGTKKDGNTVVFETECGSRYDAYYLADASVKEGIYEDLFEDVSDILNQKPDGEDGKTILEKSIYKETTFPANSKNGEGLYVLPYSISIFYGLIYDHDLFLRKGFLDTAKISEIDEIQQQGISVDKKNNNLIFKSANHPVNYKAGDIILSAGKDGVYGTYDDGQAKNMADFDSLLLKIVNDKNGMKPFCYSGIFNGMTENIVYNYVAQYEGVDIIESMFTLDSKGKDILLRDGTTSPITINNANKVIKNSDSLYKGLNFVSDYFYNDTYKHPCTGGETSHMDAQNIYLMGSLGIPGNPQSAFLIDGSWWENEANRTINDLYASGDGKKYGTTDYRFYLLPTIEGQKGADGKSGVGTPINCNLSDGFVIPKNTDRNKINAIKDFLAYMLKDDNLKLFTQRTGVLGQYDYTLNDDDKAKLTKFSQNTIEMIKDTKNISIYSSLASTNNSLIRFSSLPLIKFPMATLVDDRQYVQITQPLRDGYSVDDIINGMFDYTDKEWSDAIQSIKDRWQNI